MNFVLKLTRREIRSSWRRLLFFFLCIAIGVGSIVALRSLIGNLSQAVGGDARELLTADFVVDATNGFSPAEISKIEKIVGNASIIDGRNEILESSAMARPADESNKTVQFISLKGIENPFPLVGTFSTTGGKPFDFKLLENRGAVVAPILLETLNIKRGDQIFIGDSKFVITGSFDKEPGGSGGFRLGARVFVSKDAFEDAGISRESSRVRHRILYRTTANPTSLVAALRKELTGTALRVRSYRETQERLGEQFEKTEDFLALTGLLILVLGGVGVWNVARVFVEQKRKAVAVLKCLGASGAKIITAYILQIAVLGILGSIFGVLLAQAGLLFAQSSFNDALPETMSYQVGAGIAVQGIFLGLMISLIFSVLPLLQVRNIKPSLLLRDENNTKLRTLDPVKWLVGLLCLMGLLLVAVWQAGSWTIGAIFLIGLAAATSMLYLTAYLMVSLFKSIKKVGSFSLSQAFNSLHRPGNQTKVILLAVGLGSFVVLSVQMLQSNLVNEFDFSRNQRLPSFFFFDIQESQIKEFKRLVKSSLDEDAEIIPTVRGRISHVNGKAINYNNREVRQQQGNIGREFAFTYRKNLDEGEEIISGAWWDKTPSKLPQVSVLDTMAETLKLNVGDSMTFEISGRLVTVLISNIRKLDVRNTRTAFVFVFKPGVLDSAPHSYAANILKRVPANQRQRLQRDVIDRFPNVQIVDVAEIVAVVQKIVENFVLAISFVGSFVILSGILILIGSVSLTKSQRVYENAILKTLGAKRKTLFLILFAEYGLLGLMAGLIGTLFAGLLSYTVATWVLKIEWQANPLLLLTGLLTTIAIVTVFGVIASFSVLFKKPLSTLRSQ